VSGVIKIVPGNRTVLLTIDAPMTIDAATDGTAAAADGTAAATDGTTAAAGTTASAKGTTASADGVRVGVVGDPVRTLANCVPMQGKLTEAPVYWMHGPNKSIGLEEYAGGAVQMEFLVPPGATVFAFTV
jgi:hypothetical protein